MAGRRASQSGAVTIEFALAWTGLVAPLTFGIVFTAQLLWTWHSVTDWTREGARYAATHCVQSSGDNVSGYMRTNMPPMMDQEQFRNGPATIAVTYYSKDPDSGQLVTLTCDTECSTSCIPDTVTVVVDNYQFARFLGYLGLPPIQMPAFQASSPVESAGCDPEQQVCLP